MSNPSAQLNQRCEWQRVLSALGVRPDANFLPQLVTCPACGEARMRIYADDLLGGQWAHCSACEFAGDMIELAACVWELDIPAALERLAAELALGRFDPAVVEQYVDSRVGYRRRVAEFWLATRSELERGGTRRSCDLLKRFGRMRPGPPDEWRRDGGQFIGATSRERVEDFFQPDSYSVKLRVNRRGQRTARRGGGSGEARIFKGEGWDDVLVIAFQDLPGRTCGFLFIGRNADPAAGDLVYKPLKFGSTCHGTRQAGLAMLPSLMSNPSPLLGDKAFVMDDPFVALRLQLRYMRSQSSMLPLVLAYFGPRAATRNVITQLPPRNWIFCGTSPEMIRQARAARARVSPYQVVEEQLANGLSMMRPEQWLDRYAHQAKSWQEILWPKLKRLPPTQAEELLAGLHLRPEEYADFLACCDNTLRQLLHRIDPDRITERRVRVGQRTVVETDAGWHLAETQEQISDAVIRLEDVLHSGPNYAHYRGVVQHAGNSHQITLRCRDVERRGLLRTVRQKLLDDGLGVLNYAPDWNRESERIALALHQPQLRLGEGRMGWNRDRLAFVFCHFSIHLGDEVCEERAVLPESASIPTQGLQPAYWSPPIDARTLSCDTPEVRLTWALMTVIVHNLLAPVLFYEPVGVLLLGKFAQQLGRTLATWLGCITCPWKQHLGKPAQEAVDEIARQHDWPVFVDPPRVRPAIVTAETLTAPTWDRLIIPMARLPGLSFAALRGIHVISDDGPLRMPTIQESTVGRLIPSYLRDFLQRRRYIPQRTDFRVLDILHDIAEWYARSWEGKRGAVLTAARILDAVGQVPACKRFMDIVDRLHAEGALCETPAATAARPGQAAAIRRLPAAEGRPATVWICQPALNDELVQRRAVPLDLFTIRDSFITRGTFAQCEEHEGRSGWAIDERWWDRFGPTPTE